MIDGRLLAILTRHKERLAPDLPIELLAEIAEIEERNQYDDDRRGVLNELRKLFGDATRQRVREEETT
jgi:hypothetical protein